MNYQIKQTRHYYAPRQDEVEILPSTYEHKTCAEFFITRHDILPYHLGSGESSRPTLAVVPAYYMEPHTGMVDTAENWLAEKYHPKNMVQVSCPDVPDDFNPCNSHLYDWVEGN